MIKKTKSITQITMDAIFEKVSKAKVGDCIGTELELLKELNVSRNALREAVSRLRGIGILGSRRNYGLVVKKPDLMGIFKKMLPFYGIDELSMSELIEMRYSIEVGAMGLVVEHASKKQVAKLKALAEEFAEKSKNNSSRTEIDEIELAFHSLLLESTGNSVLSSMHSILIKFFDLVPEQIKSWDHISDLNRWEHLAIVDAIEKKDTARARMLIAAHLHNCLEISKIVKK